MLSFERSSKGGKDSTGSDSETVVLGLPSEYRLRDCMEASCLLYKIKLNGWIYQLSQ